MNEYIDRNELLDVLYAEDAITISGVSIINRFPSADVVKRKKGQWIESDLDYNFVTCSFCKEHKIDGRMALSPDYAHQLNFCPNCGADMRPTE